MTSPFRGWIKKKTKKRMIHEWWDWRHALDASECVALFTHFTHLFWALARAKINRPVIINNRTTLRFYWRTTAWQKWQRFFCMLLRLFVFVVRERCGTNEQHTCAIRSISLKMRHKRVFLFLDYKLLEM